MRSLKVAAGLVCWMGVAAGAAAQSTTVQSTDWTGQHRFTIGAEALAWWMKDSPVPVPVVTDGLVGQPETHTLLGGRDLSTGAHPGVRITGRYELNDRVGLEGNYFQFGSRSKSAGVASTGEIGSTDLLLPYIDATTHEENYTQLSAAPVFRGSAQEEVSNRLLGAELNATWPLAPVGAWRVDMLGGVRYLRLRESYTLTTSSPYLPPYGNDVWNTTDKFDTTNQFYGVQAGLRARFDQGAFFAGGTAKLALGAMDQSAGISGELVTDDFAAGGAKQTFAGGYFALPTNIGNYSRTAFAVVPEVSLNVGYRITPTATIVVAYSFMYASNVLRPGNQINRTINPSQSTAHTENPLAHLQGSAQPSFSYNDTSFWTQGVSVGVVLRF